MVITFGLLFVKVAFKTVVTILWKSDSPVVIADVFSKLLGESVIKRSMQLVLSLLLKHVFSEKIFLCYIQTKTVISMVLYLLHWNHQLEGVYCKFGGQHQLLFPSGQKSNHPLGLRDGKLQKEVIYVSSNLVQ